MKEEEAQAPEIQVGKREVAKELLAQKAKEEWRPEFGEGEKERIEEEGLKAPEPTLTGGQLLANRKLVKGVYVALVVGGRTLWKLPDTFKAEPEEVECLQDAWETLIPPDYVLPKALIVTATILGEKVAQAVALKKEAKGKAPPGVPPEVKGEGIA